MTQPSKDTRFNTLDKKKAFKESIKQALLESLDEEIDAALKAANMAQSTASDANNKPENQYDTLALEAAYLAHGQSERILQIQKLRIAIAQWPLPKLNSEGVIRPGCYVELISENGLQQAFFIAPVGGRVITINEERVMLVSQEATLAQTIIGRAEGEEVQLTLGQTQQWWEITQVF